MHRHGLAEEIVQTGTIRRLVSGAFMVVLVPIDGIQSMADLAGQFRRTVAEKTAVGIPLHFTPRPGTGIAQAPLVDVVAGGTGDNSRADLSSRDDIEEGEKGPIETVSRRHVNDRNRRVKGIDRHLGGN